jgi:DNA-binding IclR family transcriptional regulator
MASMAPSPLPYGTAALDRGLALLQAITRDGAERPLGVIADELGLPESTARRMAMLLLQRGFLVRVAPGRFAAGPALLGLPEPRRVVADIARQPMQRLARTVRATVHLGLIEDDMVTYIAKVHGGGPHVLTREGMQLEAYCSAIGRVLLALQPEQLIRAYLSSAPFIALTGKTETDPERIGQLLAMVRDQGHAVEQEEVMEGLYCTAVPIPDTGADHLPAGIRQLAVSVSRVRAAPLTAALIVSDRRRLDACADEIAARLALKG